MPVLQICQECRNDFWTRPGLVGIQKYCGPICQGIAARQPLPIRFWRRVDKTPGYGPWGDCWIWFGSVNNKDYGRIYSGFPCNRVILAHVASWLIHFGPVPQGHGVLHKCDYPPCVRPEHLFTGTQKDNADDMMKKNRQCWGQDRPFSKLTHKQVLEIRELYKSRKGEWGLITSLAGQYGMKPRTMNKVIRGKTYRQISGAVTGCMKLTKEDIPFIRNLLANGQSYPWIAAIYGVSTQAIYKIAIGKSWRHVL